LNLSKRHRTGIRCAIVGFFATQGLFGLEKKIHLRADKQWFCGKPFRKIRLFAGMASEG